jgi:hypothetical protein
MKARYSNKLFVLIALISFLIFPFIPVKAAGGKALPEFSDFIRTVMDGRSGVVSGVYVPGILAFKIIQQPAGTPGYVSSVDGVVTQFGMSIPYGVIGLLAHDNLAGENFINLKSGQEVRIIYGDGKISYYTIISINQYKATDSHSTTSNFTDLNTGTIYTAAQIFIMYYQGGDQVTFQTCISQDGNLSWGRLFITASPGMPIKTVAGNINIFHHFLYK